MSIFRVLNCTAILFGSVSFCQAGEILDLDANASKIEFVGKKTDGKHAGGFKKFTSKATVNHEEPEKGSLEIEIDTTSLWSDDEKLTNHLKNPDFFDVRKYPKITFKSKAILTEKEEPKAKIKGEMTILDKTVEIEVPCSVVIAEKSIEVDATFSIDRTRWGMTYGEGKIDKDVDIKAHLVFKR